MKTTNLPPSSGPGGTEVCKQGKCKENIHEVYYFDHVGKDDEILEAWMY